MIQKKKGFTLIELLAVIVILAIIITIASTSVMSIMKKARERTAEEMRNSLSDAALTYVLDNYRLQKCSKEFSKEVFENKNISNLSSNETCARKITVATLKSDGIFEDNKKYCDEDDFVIVYRYTNDTESEYKTYVDNNACTN